MQAHCLHHPVYHCSSSPASSALSTWRNCWMNGCVKLGQTHPPTQCGPEMLTEGAGGTSPRSLVPLHWWPKPTSHILSAGRQRVVCMYIQQMAHRCGSLKFISWKPTLKAIALGGGAYCDAEVMRGGHCKQDQCLDKGDPESSCPFCVRTQQEDTFSEPESDPQTPQLPSSLVTATLQDSDNELVSLACNAI